ncbi:MAG: hypothetical protein M1826_003731 [Phylliscum demangeonii]|nr:MAG: hypothetical protein M1826_003731 [Phylliscum demangeonii]
MVCLGGGGGGGCGMGGAVLIAWAVLWATTTQASRIPLVTGPNRCPGWHEAGLPPDHGLARRSTSGGSSSSSNWDIHALPPHPLEAAATLGTEEMHRQLNQDLFDLLECFFVEAWKRQRFGSDPREPDLTWEEMEEYARFVVYYLARNKDHPAWPDGPAVEKPKDLRHLRRIRARRHVPPTTLALPDARDLDRGPKEPEGGSGGSAAGGAAPTPGVEQPLQHAANSNGLLQFGMARALPSMASTGQRVIGLLAGRGRRRASGWEAGLTRFIRRVPRRVLAEPVLAY